MDKISTIDDLMLAEPCDIYAEGPIFSESGYSHNQVRKLAINFAQLHVKAALQAACENSEIIHNGYDWIADDQTILNAYPLNLIQ